MGRGWIQFNPARSAAARPLDARAAVGAPGIPSAAPLSPPKKKETEPHRASRTRYPESWRALGASLPNQKRNRSPQSHRSSPFPNESVACPPLPVPTRPAPRCHRHNQRLCKEASNQYSLKTIAAEGRVRFWWPGGETSAQSQDRGPSALAPAFTHPRCHLCRVQWGWRGVRASRWTLVHSLHVLAANPACVRRHFRSVATGTARRDWLVARGDSVVGPDWSRTGFENAPGRSGASGADPRRFSFLVGNPAPPWHLRWLAEQSNSWPPNSNTHSPCTLSPVPRWLKARAS